MFIFLLLTNLIFSGDSSLVDFLKSKYPDGNSSKLVELYSLIKDKTELQNSSLEGDTQVNNFFSFIKTESFDFSLLGRLLYIGVEKGTFKNQEFISKFKTYYEDIDKSFRGVVFKLKYSSHNEELANFSEQIFECIRYGKNFEGQIYNTTKIHSSDDRIELNNLISLINRYAGESNKQNLKNIVEPLINEWDQMAKNPSNALPSGEAKMKNAFDEAFGR